MVRKMFDTVYKSETVLELTHHVKPAEPKWIKSKINDLKIQFWS